MAGDSGARMQMLESLCTYVRTAAIPMLRGVIDDLDKLGNPGLARDLRECREFLHRWSRVQPPPVMENPVGVRLESAEYGFREALRGIDEILGTYLKKAHEQGQSPADARVNVSELLLLVRRHRENPPIPFEGRAAEGTIVGGDVHADVKPALTIELDAVPVPLHIGDRVHVRWLASHAAAEGGPRG